MSSIVGPLPVILANGTVNDAGQVMTDLNWIVSQINANGSPAIVAANIGMNGFKLTNLAAGTTAGDSVNYTQFINQSVASVAVSGAFSAATSTVSGLASSLLSVVGNGPWANPASGDTEHLLEIVNDNSPYQCMALNAYGVATNGNNLHWNRYFGTLAAPTPIGNGAYMMSMGFRGWDGSGTLSQSQAAFQCSAREAWSSTAHGCGFHLAITKTGGSGLSRSDALDIAGTTSDSVILLVGDGSSLFSRVINNGTTGALQIHGSGDQTGAQTIWFGSANAGQPNQAWHRADTLRFQDRSGNETINIDLVGQQLHFVGLGGFGYYAGAGSSLSQPTAKTDGITLNTPSAKITMNAALLIANTAVSFTWTNSKIGADDHVIVTIRGGATAGAYIAQADQISAGSARISLRNVTGGNLSEAVVLQVSVLKGAST